MKALQGAPKGERERSEQSVNPHPSVPPLHVAGSLPALDPHPSIPSPRLLFIHKYFKVYRIERFLTAFGMTIAVRLMGQKRRFANNSCNREQIFYRETPLLPNPN